LEHVRDDAELSQHIRSISRALPCCLAMKHNVESTCQPVDAGVDLD
jgi:hypothetical protein